MNVLITGGAGFIGSHTADSLLKKGHHVKILDILKKPVHMNGFPEYLDKTKVEFIFFYNFINQRSASNIN
jgi:dTDP-L-rhamnose 4-epimerase